MRLLHPANLPDCKMQRIICHWTAGPYEVDELDKIHYHFIIAKNGNVVLGHHPISDNAAPIKGDNYAAHTLHCNSGSIGISMACMLNAVESPFDAGPCPMLEVQWDSMCQVAAELCEKYGIPVTPQTVLGHGEVQRILGIPQRGKWDPLALPWHDAPIRSVGDALRKDVAGMLVGLGNADAETPKQQITIVLPTGKCDGYLEDGHAWVPVRAVIESFGGKLTNVVGKSVGFELVKGNSMRTISGVLQGGKLFVPARDLAAMCVFQLSWDPATKTLTIA